MGGRRAGGHWRSPGYDTGLWVFTKIELTIADVECPFHFFLLHE